MNDPNLDAWDRHCDQVDQAVTDEIAFYREMHDEIFATMLKLVETGEYDGKVLLKRALLIVRPLWEAQQEPC
jgi:replicative DNA helicase